MSILDEDDCILCYKKITENQFSNIINQALKRKYCENLEDEFYEKPIRNILNQAKSIELLFYTETKIDNDRSNYFKRFYKKNEFASKIRLFKDYYIEKYNKPNVYIKSIFKIQFKFYYLKERLYKGKEIYDDEITVSETSSHSNILSLSKLKNILQSFSHKKKKPKFMIFNKIKKNRLNTTNELLDILEISKIKEIEDPSFIKKEIKNEKKSKNKSSKLNKNILKNSKLFKKKKSKNEILTLRKNKKSRISTKFKISKILYKNFKLENINKYDLNKKYTNNYNCSSKGKLVKGSNFKKKKKIQNLKTFKQIKKTTRSNKVNKIKVLKPNSLTILNFNYNKNINKVKMNFFKKNKNSKEILTTNRSKINTKRIKNFSLDFQNKLKKLLIKN